MKFAIAWSIISFTGYAIAQESCTALATLVPSCAVSNSCLLKLIWSELTLLQTACIESAASVLGCATNDYACQVSSKYSHLRHFVAQGKFFPIRETCQISQRFLIVGLHPLCSKFLTKLLVYPCNFSKYSYRRTRMCYQCLRYCYRPCS
jgi:hypothetical protein